MFSSSPRNVHSFLLDEDIHSRKESISFQHFLKELPHAIRQRKMMIHDVNDPITELFQNVNLHKNDWIAYCHCDPKLPYTRNLVATDDETYTLLLLCWNPQQTSPIHDHPYDGCWMRVVQGHIREERFIANETMYRTHDQMFGVGQLLFMEDSLGYHRVSNPSKSDLAVTLHLYCPPYQQCKTWSHEEQLQPKIGNIHHYSEYGKKL